MRQHAGGMYHPGSRSAHRPEAGHRTSGGRRPVARDAHQRGAFREFIAREVAKGRNSTSIYQDLVEHHGYAGSYDAVKRLARKLRPHNPKIGCRFETDPGQEAQVD